MLAALSQQDRLYAALSHPPPSPGGRRFSLRPLRRDTMLEWSFSCSDHSRTSGSRPRGVSAIHSQDKAVNCEEQPEELSYQCVRPCEDHNRPTPRRLRDLRCKSAEPRHRARLTDNAAFSHFHCSSAAVGVGTQAISSSHGGSESHCWSHISITVSSSCKSQTWRISGTKVLRRKMDKGKGFFFSSGFPQITLREKPRQRSSARIHRGFWAFSKGRSTRPCGVTHHTYPPIGRSLFLPLW